MDHISKLTDEEVKTVCGMIPIKYFRDAFKSNTQKFHKLCPGHRPEKVLPDTVGKLVASHRDDPFLSDVLNNGIRLLLDIVQKELSKFTDAGDDDQTALLRALPESDFHDHIALYLMLSMENCPAEYARLLESAIKEISARRKSVETYEEMKQTPGADTTAALMEKLTALEQNTELEREMHSREIESLTAQCAGLQEKLHAVQAAYEKKEQELSVLQELIDLADLPTESTMDNTYPYISLCRAGGQSGNSFELFRLADIVDGTICLQRQADAPNREKLFTKSYKPTNFIGIWRWRTEPNFNPEKLDYIVSEFQAGQVPTEIIIVPDCDSTDDLKERLTQGIENGPQGERALFAFPVDGKYTGFLCRTQDFSFQNGRTILKPTVAKLPLYEFSDQEIVKFGRSWFYYRISLGVPRAVFPIIDPFQAVKDAVLRRVPWSRMKTWFSRKDTQKFQDLLREMPAEGIYQEIADTCACSADEARSYVDSFIQQAETYLQQEDIESDVLLLALERSPAFLEKCQGLIEEEWRRKHSQQIREAEAEFSRVSKDTQVQREQYEQLAGQQKQLQTRLERITAELAEKEQLASDVEEKVAQRIDAAKKSAADFICEMAFSQPSITAHSTYSPEEHYLFQPGIPLNSKTLVENETWEDLLDTIMIELEEAGVSSEYSLAFAAYLYAAYHARIPLLLAGPNSRDIADALSAAVSGETASVLYCGGVFSQSAVEECIGSNGQITVAVDALSAGWVNHIADLSAMQGKFLIVAHPFAEDLMIEPRGLYNYVLPVLTELVVDRPAARGFKGGYMCEGFQHYTSEEPERKLPFKSQLMLSPLVSHRLRQVRTDMRTLLHGNNSKTDLLFDLFPYAYVTGRAANLWEEMQGALSREARELVRAFLGESE